MLIDHCRQSSDDYEALLLLERRRRRKQHSSRSTYSLYFLHVHIHVMFVNGLLRDVL